MISALMPDQNQSLPPAVPLLNPLTRCEWKVLVWVSRGKTDWETGIILACKASTVKKHLQRIYRKLGVSNRVSAANWLRSEGCYAAAA